MQSATFFILSLRAASSSLWTDWITGSSPSPVNLELVNLSNPINTYQRLSPLKLLLLSSSHVLEHPLLVSGALSVFHFWLRLILTTFYVLSLFSFISLSNCPITINPNPDGYLRLSLHAPLRPSLPTQQTLPTPLCALSSNFHLTRSCSHSIL